MSHYFFLQGMFSKRRQLILTDVPRLYYVDPVGMSLKGEIAWYDKYLYNQEHINTPL